MNLMAAILLGAHMTTLKSGRYLNLLLFRYSYSLAECQCSLRAALLAHRLLSPGIQGVNRFPTCSRLASLSRFTTICSVTSTPDVEVSFSSRKLPIIVLRRFALVAANSRLGGDSDASELHEVSEFSSSSRVAGTVSTVEESVVQEESEQQQDKGLLDWHSSKSLFLEICPFVTNCTTAEFAARVQFLTGIGANLDQILSDCPLLLAQYLDFRRTLQCLQTLGLHRTLLGKLLMQDPEVVKHLTGRRFINKIRLLECLNFPRNEIGNLLDGLSTNIKDLAAFICLPLENLTFVSVFLRMLGLKEKDCRIVLRRVPTLFLCDRNSLKQIIHLLERVSDTRDTVCRIILSCPLLLLQNADCLSKTVEYLDNICEDRWVLARCLQTKADILLYSKDAIQSAVDSQYSLRMERKMAALLLICRPHLVKCGSKALKKNGSSLKNHGLNKRTLYRLFLHNLIFANDIKKDVKIKIKTLEKRGFTGDGLSIPNCSREASVKTMNASPTFADQPGLDKKTSDMAGALITSIYRSKRHSAKQIADLIRLGFTEDKVYKMIKDFSGLLSMTDKDITTKVDFLVNTMHRPVQELEKCPAFFSCDLEMQIKPRFRVLQLLKGTGLLRKDASLSTIVHMSSDWFHRLYVECHPQGVAMYKGDTEFSNFGKDE